MSRINEDQVEQISIDWFKELEYDYLNGFDIAPDGENPQRNSYDEVLLLAQLKSSLINLNPELPDTGIDEAIDIIKKQEHTGLYQNNKKLPQNADRWGFNHNPTK